MTKHLSYLSPREIVKISSYRQGKLGRVGPLLSLLSALHPFYLSILIALVCLVLSFFELAFLAAFLTIIFFLLLFYNRTKSAAAAIEITREVPAKALEDSEVKIIYRIKNGSNQSVGPLIFKDGFSGSIKRNHYMRIESGLGAKQWVRYSHSFKVDRGIGLQNFSGLRATVQDPFGFFGFNVEFLDKDTIDIHPKTRSLAQVGLTGIEEITRFGNLDVQIFGDSPCFSGARDYRSGDPKKWISWKLSARRGALVVKEYEKLSSSDISIFVEMNSKYHLENLKRDSVDEVKKIGILLAKQLASQNASLQLFSQNQVLFRDHSYFTTESLIRSMRHLQHSLDQESLFDKYIRFVKPGEYVLYLSAFYLLPVDQLIKKFEVLLARQVKLIGVFVDVSSIVDRRVFGLTAQQKKELDLTAQGRMAELQTWFNRHSQQVYFCQPDGGDDLQKKILTETEMSR